jgi:hypothetical protein
MFAIAGVAASERGFAGGADFVAAAIVDRFLHRIARGDFFLGHGREIIDAKEGQDDQRSSGFEERVAGHWVGMAWGWLRGGGYTPL